VTNDAALFYETRGPEGTQLLMNERDLYRGAYLRAHNKLTMAALDVTAALVVLPQPTNLPPSVEHALPVEDAEDSYLSWIMTGCRIIGAGWAVQKWWLLLVPPPDSTSSATSKSFFTLDDVLNLTSPCPIPDGWRPSAQRRNKV
jgi:hypothetical protein